MKYYEFSKNNFKPFIKNIRMNNVNELNEKKECMNIKLCPNNKFLALGNFDGEVEIFYEERFSFTKFLGSPKNYSITSLKWNNKGNILRTISCDGYFSKFNINDKYEFENKFICESGLYSLDNNINDHYSILGSGNGKMFLYNNEKLQIEREYPMASFGIEGHSSKITSLKFVPWSQYVFISAGWDGTWMIWDLRDKKPINEFYGFKMNYDLIDCIKNKNILLGLNEGENPVGVYDFSTMKLMETIDVGPYPNCSQIMFSKSNNHIITTSMAYKNIKIFEKVVDNYEITWEIEGFSKEIFSSDFSTNNLVAINENKVYFFEINKFT